jgi:toxin CptA
MSHYSVKPIQLDLQPAYLLAYLLASVALAVCCIVVFMPIPAAIKLSIVLLVLISMLYYIAQDALQWLPWSYRRLEINVQGVFLATRQDGIKSTVSVLPDSFVAAYLTVVNLQVEGRRWRRHVIITPDRVDPKAFRQLRVWLRWGHTE